MMGILGLFADRGWQHLVAALLHTLWQGAIVSLLLAMALRRLPASRHDARYLLALSAQFVVLLMGLATWSILGYEPPSTAEVATAPAHSALPRPTATAAIATATPPSPGDPEPAWSWTSLLASAWLAGVLLMLGRTIGSVWSASRLARGPVVDDPVIRAVVERIRIDLGIGRMIRIVEAAEGCGPSVLGIVWPTLLLPASAMTGLSPEMLRALLIHELAHTRRHDYLANIAQMVVESLLFFNPMVWWLGRQARLEREACCDAAAVRLTGRPLDYSRSLAEWAGRSGGPSVAPAWGGDGRPGTLLERIRRVLRPGERPSVRISIGGLVLLLVAGPLLLALLWRGTDTAVRVAAQVLSPAERVARIQEALEAYAPLAARPDGEGTLKGTIRTPDGTPLEKPVRFYYSVRRPNGNGDMGTLLEYRDTFSVEVPAGTVWLSLAPDDYAPAVVGPFEVGPGQTIDGIAIRLETGFPARITVTDADGAPVAGARLTAHRIIGGNGSVGPSKIGWTTDRDGVATIPHAVAEPYNASVKAGGFQPLANVKVTPSASEAVTLTLSRARPVRGVAVDPSGKPVAGAEIRVLSEKGPESSRLHGISGPMLATTDRDGRFLLDTLETGTTYALLMAEKSKTGMHGIVTGVVAGQPEEIRTSLSPKRTIQGTVKAGGEVPLSWTISVIQSIPGGIHGEGIIRFGRGIRVDTERHFEATDLFPGATQIQVDRQTFDVKLEGPVTPVTLELTRREPPPGGPIRRVVLHVKTPDGSIPPRGTIRVSTVRQGERQAAYAREVPIENGRVALDVPAPGKILYDLLAMSGYWFPDDSDVQVQSGAGAQVVEIEAVPAGAIVGRVLDADGKPAVGDVDVGCRTVERSPGMRNHPFNKDNVRVDAEGRFFIAPVPLGGAYAVVAAQGHNKQVSATVRLDGSKPTERVTLKLARTASATGRVIDADGKPLAGDPVKLKLAHPIASTVWGPPITTGDDGRFRFDELSVELDGYHAAVDGVAGYQPAEAPLHPGGPPTTIRLERGHVIEGRILDAKTGWPIPGVEVYATRSTFVRGQRYAYEAEGKTDDHGRFRFSNLPEGRWKLGDRDGLTWRAPDHNQAFDVDRPESVEVFATLPDWSDLKPRR